MSAMSESQPLLQGDGHAAPSPSAPPPPSYSEVDENKLSAGERVIESLVEGETVLCFLTFSSSLLLCCVMS